MHIMYLHSCIQEHQHVHALTETSFHSERYRCRYLICFACTRVFLHPCCTKDFPTRSVFEPGEDSVHGKTLELRILLWWWIQPVKWNACSLIRFCCYGCQCTSDVSSMNVDIFFSFLVVGFVTSAESSHWDHDAYSGSAWPMFHASCFIWVASLIVNSSCKVFLHLEELYSFHSKLPGNLRLTLKSLTGWQR